MKPNLILGEFKRNNSNDWTIVVNSGGLPNTTSRLSIRNFRQVIEWAPVQFLPTDNPIRFTNMRGDEFRNENFVRNLSNKQCVTP